MAKEFDLTNKETRKFILKNIKDIQKGILKTKLVDDFIKSKNLSKEQLSDRKPGGIINKLSCDFYTALQRLVNAGCISVNEVGLIKFIKDEDPDGIDRAIEIEEILRTITAENKFSKELLLDTVSNKYFENHPKIPCENNSKNAVKGDAGNILKKLVDDKVIIKDGETYGNDRPAVPDRDKNKADIAAMKSNTYLFVSHTVNMLSKFMQQCCQYDEVQSEIIDRTPKDDGVDGLLTYRDKFGRVVKVIIQVKHRDNSVKQNKREQVGEVRGFAGVLACKQDALQGIFVTNIAYSDHAKKFAEEYKLKYLLLIDGEKWLDLAEQCKYVISEINL
ncbi:MAG: restriction endonuclease [Clostridia bacterium]|nr:restriction endonuclease [Clostridia bacterium]